MGVYVYMYVTTEIKTIIRHYRSIFWLQILFATYACVYVCIYLYVCYVFFSLFFSLPSSLSPSHSLCVRVRACVYVCVCMKVLINTLLLINEYWIVWILLQWILTSISLDGIYIKILYMTKYTYILYFFAYINLYTQRI